MGSMIQGLPNPHNITTWQVQEDITSLDPGDTGTGVGQITFTTTDWPLSRMLSGTDVVLKDTVHGTTVATVRDVNGDGVTVAVTADSELANLNAYRTAAPFSGQLSNLFQYYLDLSNVYAPLNYQAANYRVDVPGFVGNVWDQVKQLCSAHAVEIAQVGDEIVVRSVRRREITVPNETEYGFNLNRQEAALAVDVAYYNHRAITKGEVFPVVGEEPPIHSVAAGETIEYELTVDASLRTVHQPVCVQAAGPGNRSGSNGVYTVVGNDNLPIMPQQWNNSGGRVEAIITDEPGQIILRITGAQIAHLSPFRIAESAGGEDYNSLHITGDGVAWRRQGVRLYTGADPLKVSTEVGSTIDNPYISSRAQAFRTGVHAAIAYSGSQTVINGGTSTVKGVDQSFGNVIGSRIKKDLAYYRVSSTTTSPEGIGFSGEIDTTVRDFNTEWRGLTTAQFNTLWHEMTAGQFSAFPLRVPERASGTLEENVFGGGVYGRGTYGDGG